MIPVKVDYQQMVQTSAEFIAVQYLHERLRFNCLSVPFFIVLTTSHNKDIVYLGLFEIDNYLDNHFICRYTNATLCLNKERFSVQF